MISIDKVISRKTNLVIQVTFSKSGCVEPFAISVCFSGSECVELVMVSVCLTRSGCVEPVVISVYFCHMSNDCPNENFSWGF